MEIQSEVVRSQTVNELRSACATDHIHKAACYERVADLTERTAFFGVEVLDGETFRVTDEASTAAKIAAPTARQAGQRIGVERLVLRLTALVQARAALDPTANPTTVARLDREITRIKAMLP